MNPIGIVKTVAGVASSVGVGAIVKNIIITTTPENVTKLQKASIFIGSVVLSGMIGDMATKYVNTTIDNTVEQFKTAQEAIVQIQTPES
jgi:hypothetical protein